MRRSEDFDSGLTIVCLGAAADAGVLLPTRALHPLVGQVLQALHDAGKP